MKILCDHLSPLTQTHRVLLLLNDQRSDFLNDQCFQLNFLGLAAIPLRDQSFLLRHLTVLFPDLNEENMKVKYAKN